MKAARTGTSRFARVKGSLTAGQWRTLMAMATVIALLHLVGFGLLFLFVAPGNYSLGRSGSFTAGVGFTAYALGMRHAFDADHLSAIDNTTRKLMDEGRRPMSVGFFFSFGHSTIVFVLALLFALGVRSLGGPVLDDGSSLHAVAGWIGTGVSGTFLLLIAGLNFVILVGILRVARDMKRGRYEEAQLEDQLERRGLMSRFYRRFTKTVTKPWQMYPIGALFGLGFDTATEVALLFLAAGAAGAGLPFYAILCPPVLFAAGMSLLDTLDGSFMNLAYGWAFSKPARKVFYNIVITALSVLIALVIGLVEIVALLSEKANLSGSPWKWVQGLDINTAGLVIAGLFAVTWVVALSYWHFGHVEQRWTEPPGDTESI